MKGMHRITAKELKDSARLVNDILRESPSTVHRGIRKAQANALDAVMYALNCHDVNWQRYSKRDVADLERWEKALQSDCSDVRMKALREYRARKIGG